MVSPLRLLRNLLRLGGATTPPARTSLLYALRGWQFNLVSKPSLNVHNPIKALSAFRMDRRREKMGPSMCSIVECSNRYMSNGSEIRLVNRPKGTRQMLLPWRSLQGGFRNRSRHCAELPTPSLGRGFLMRLKAPVIRLFPGPNSLTSPLFWF